MWPAARGRQAVGGASCEGGARQSSCCCWRSVQQAETVRHGPCIASCSPSRQRCSPLCTSSGRRVAGRNLPASGGTRLECLANRSGAAAAQHPIRAGTSRSQRPSGWQRRPHHRRAVHALVRQRWEGCAWGAPAGHGGDEPFPIKLGCCLHASRPAVQAALWQRVLCRSAEKGHAACRRFDAPRFYRECRRVLMPAGALAVFSYIPLQIGFPSSKAASEVLQK